MADRMADRPSARYPGPAGAPGPSDEPLIDRIFPNRQAPRQNGFASAGRDPDQTAELHHPPPDAFRPPLRDAFRHRQTGRVSRQVGQGTSAEARPADAGTANPLVRRRRMLIGLGAGAVAAGGAGVAVAMFTGDDPGNPDAGLAGSGGGDAGRPGDTADNGLGAAGLAESPAAAAEIASRQQLAKPTPLARDPELHLLRRATFGPTPADLAALRKMGINAWLDRQLNPSAIDDPDGDKVTRLYPTVGMSTVQLQKTLDDYSWDAMYDLGQATLARQMWSSRQLYEVMVDFWANHLNVTNPIEGGWYLRTPFDKDVIRKYALGRFAEMLHASARHPTMLWYLDNEQNRRSTVNENYGRELLELHTVGIEAKYTEKDVRNSAYIMTGRTLDNETGIFHYRADDHRTGAVKVLGFTHANKSGSGGLAMGDAYLKYLVTHPSTAKRLARKLAVRFVADDPPQTLVDRLAQAYLDNDTAIVPVLRTLFRSVEFWMAPGLKTRRPGENLVATARVLGVGPGKNTTEGVEGLYWLSSQLGHAPLAWMPPDGYPDYAEAWGSAHATLGTWNAHRALAQGWHKGLSYSAPQNLVGAAPATVGEYLDTLARRLVFQPLPATQKNALLAFLGAKATTKVSNLRLDGKIDHLVPLLLDSVYHALR